MHRRERFLQHESHLVHELFALPEPAFRRHISYVGRVSTSYCSLVITACTALLEAFKLAGMALTGYNGVVDSCVEDWIRGLGG